MWGGVSIIIVMMPKLTVDVGNDYLRNASAEASVKLVGGGECPLAAGVRGAWSMRLGG